MSSEPPKLWGRMSLTPIILFLSKLMAGEIGAGLDDPSLTTKFNFLVVTREN